MHHFLRLVTLLSFLFVTAHGAAQTQLCDTLRGAQKQTSQAVLKTQHPYDCCDGTLSECLAQKPVCPLVTRLANDVCRRAAQGQSQQDIERELQRRAASAIAPKVAIDVSAASVAGDRSARVEIVAYVCGRCPYCAKLVPLLYESVTKGRLKGKAKLVVRPFPIRSHKHSTLAGKAMVAAERMGQFWPFLLHLYAHFDQFDPDKVAECAAHAGLDAERFRSLLNEPGVEQALVTSKKEGVRNHVEATPTLFIKGRAYSADLALGAIEDFVEERIETH
jgi:protein-disulfide isomerase